MASKNMDNTIYIHKMPFKERQDLVDILNSGDAWRTLGGYYMKYSTVDLDKFATVCTIRGLPDDYKINYPYDVIINEKDLLYDIYRGSPVK